MILVLMISWLRYFSYFLVIRLISKLTITLFSMIKETVSFLIILSCYLILLTTVFATLFRDVETDDASAYQSMSRSFREMTTYFIGAYEGKEMANFTTSHSILYMAHVLISNIFLKNYLIAILTTVYNIMINNGDFYAIEY